MEKIKRIREAMVSRGYKPGDLEHMVHNHWCTVELGKSYAPTVDQFDDLYVGLISGVWCNLGEGKVPEKLDWIGPSPENRYSMESYESVLAELVCTLGSEAYPQKEWLAANPESDAWVEIIREGLEVEKTFRDASESWMSALRKKCIGLMQKKRNET